MSKVRRPAPPDPPERKGNQGGKKKVRKLAKSPCSRPPAMPTGVRVLFNVREVKTHLEYEKIVRWNEVTEDTFGLSTRISRYHVQMRATDHNGVPIRWDDPGEDEPDTILVEGPGGKFIIVHRRVVDKPRDEDPDDSAMVSFGHAARPKKWEWQARVRAEDTSGCKSEWSPWSDHHSPLDAQFTRPRPPTPTGVTLEFSSIDRGRWDRWVAIVTCNEVGPWDIPGGDSEDDVAFYVCQLQGGRTQEGPFDGNIRTLTRSARDGDADTITGFVFTHKIKKHRWYRARVRTIDRFNRRGAWSEWTTAGSPSDETDPPQNENVVAYGRHNHVGIDWRKPDHPDDPDLPHPDIAYAQVQLATASSFASDKILRFDKMVMGSRKEWESTEYRKRFWLRVRNVDGSDNKGAWVSAGPVRPTKVKGKRNVVGATPQEAEIDLDGIVGGVSNRAYRVGTAQALATIDGESAHGLLTMRLQTARTTNEIAVGAIMRYTDSDNYLIVQLREGGGIDGVRIISRVAGSNTTRLNTTGSFQVRKNQVYDLRVLITSGGLMQVFLNDVQRGSYQLTGTELAALTGTRHGLIIESADDGTSRIEEFTFTPTNDTVPTIDDGFTRTASASSLGTADSGQDWTTHQGTFGISPDSVPDAVFADLWANGDSDQINNVNIVSSGHRKVGEDGQASGGIEIEIDRPTRFNASGSSHILNTEGSAFKVLLFLVAVDDSNGNEYLGKAGRVWCEANDASNDRPRHVTAQHDLFIDCPPGQTKIVRWWWGYRCGGSTNRTCHVGPQAMTIQWRDASDMTEGGGARLTRPGFTRSSVTIARYRRSANNE